MFRLSINFDTSSIISLNCDGGWTNRICGVLGCNNGRLLMKYLRILVGSNPKRIGTWKPIIDRIKKKLSTWKVKILFKAGRLVLIKAVLNSLPLYYLGLFKMPIEVAKKIVSL